MIDVLELRSTIETALADHLGTYLYSNGLTVPAIWVEEGETLLERSIAGLEVVIRPSLEVPIALTLDGYSQTFTAMVTLKQWDVEQTTLEAMPLLLSALRSIDFLQVGSPRRIVRSSKLDNIETLSVPISQSFLTQTELDEEW